MSIKLSDARINVTDGVLHVSEGTYGVEKIDRALLTILSEFVDYTRCVTESKTVACQAGEPSINLAVGDGLSQLLPAYLLSMSIGFSPVRRADDDWISRRLDADSTTGKPRFYAPETPTSYHLYPTPDQAYVLNLTVNSPFSEFPIGAPGSTVINLPIRFLRLPLWTGTAALMVYGEATNNPWPIKGWELYLAFREEVRQICGMDAGAIQSPAWQPTLDDMKQRMKKAA